jgi:hypothetical protein
MGEHAILQPIHFRASAFEGSVHGSFGKIERNMPTDRSDLIDSRRTRHLELQKVFFP